MNRYNKYKNKHVVVGKRRFVGQKWPLHRRTERINGWTKRPLSLLWSGRVFLNLHSLRIKTITFLERTSQNDTTVAVWRRAENSPRLFLCATVTGRKKRCNNNTDKIECPPNRVRDTEELPLDNRESTQVEEWKTDRRYGLLALLALPDKTDTNKVGDYRTGCINSWQKSSSPSPNYSFRFF